MAVRLAGTPCSPLYKRHSFPGTELAAVVATHLPDDEVVSCFWVRKR
jgi:hypothetical protein